MIEKRRSIRVDVNNICELKIQGTTDSEFCFLKDVSILGLGFFSKEIYNKDDIADFTIVLGNKIINLEVTIIAAYHKTEGQCRYGATITRIDDISKEILEDYITEKAHKNWQEKVKELIR